MNEDNFTFGDWGLGPIPNIIIKNFKTIKFKCQIKIFII